jgi:hypothetical protein
MLIGIVSVAVLIIIVVTIVFFSLNKDGEVDPSATPTTSGSVSAITPPAGEPTATTEFPNDVAVTQIVFMNIKNDYFELAGPGGTFPLGGRDGLNEDVILSPTEATGRTTIRWSSENEAVAIVNPITGLVEAIGPGTTRIIVKAGEAERAVTVTVLSPDIANPNNSPPPSSSSNPGGQSTAPSGGIIKFSTNNDVSLSLSGKAPLSKDFTLKVKLSNESTWATEGVVYYSTNTDVATVNDKGLVTAVKKGQCKIKVTYKGQEATCDIHVTG